MKRKTTKELLSESFKEIANVKDANKITVNDIVTNCGMSPATFYRHFKDKYDLVAWMYQNRINEICYRFGTASGYRQKVVAAWVDFCEENKAFILNLMNNTNGYDSFLSCMVNAHCQIIESCVVMSSGEEALTHKVRMSIYIHASGVVRLMFSWLMDETHATRDELAETIYETMPAKLLALLKPAPGEAQ